VGRGESPDWEGHRRGDKDGENTEEMRGAGEREGQRRIIGRETLLGGEENNGNRFNEHHLHRNTNRVYHRPVVTGCITIRR
jgi:hypothetical protein